jgi:hypothetical protein
MTLAVWQGEIDLLPFQFLELADQLFNRAKR